MKRSIETGLILLVLSASLAGCKKEEETPEPVKPAISLDTESLSVGAGAATEYVSVTANADWTAAVTAGAAWLSVAPPKGRASEEAADVLVRIKANSTAEAREGTVAFSISDAVSATLTVTQEASPGGDTPQPQPERLATPEVTLKAAGPDYLVFRWTLSDNIWCGDYEWEFLAGGTVLRTMKMSQASGASRLADATYLYDSAVIFAPLDNNTPYAFRVRALSDEESIIGTSEWGEGSGTTLPAFVETETGALLVERFNRFYYAGDYINRAWGMRPTDAEAKVITSFDDEVTMLQYPDGTTGDYFNTGSFPAAFRNGSLGLEGWSGTKVYGQFGFPKMGTSSAQGSLTTPALSGISGTSNLEVTFKAMPYCDLKQGAEPDPVTVVVDVLGAGKADASLFELEFKDYGWTEYTFHVGNAAADTRIQFLGTGTKCRFYIDDIVIKPYSGSVDTGETPAPQNVRLIEAHPTDIAFEWDEVGENLSRIYKVYLYDASGSVLRSHEVTYAAKYFRTGFTFAGLEPATTYGVGVQYKDSGISTLSVETTRRTAVGSDVLFWMPFDACRWGGDHVLNTYGAAPSNNNTASSDPLAEMNTVKDPNSGGSANVFGTMSDAWRAQRGLSAWPKGTAVYEFPGYIKFGAASSAGTVALPALTALGDSPRDIILTFDVSPWVEPTTDPDVHPSDAATAVVTVSAGPGAIYADGAAVSEAAIDVGVLPQRQWTTQTVFIKGVTASTTILLNSRNTADGSAKGARWCLDNIKVVLDPEQTDYSIGGGNGGNLGDNQW